MIMAADEMGQAIWLSMKNDDYRRECHEDMGLTGSDCEDELQKVLFFSAIEAGQEEPQNYAEFCSKYQSPPPAPPARDISFESWRNRPVEERSSEIFVSHVTAGGRSAVPASTLTYVSNDASPKRKKSKSPPVRPFGSPTGRVSSPSDGSRATLPVGANYVAEDAPPLSLGQIRPFASLPKPIDICDEEEQLRKALDISMRETRMDFEGATQLGVQASLKGLANQLKQDLNLGAKPKIRMKEEVNRVNNINKYNNINLTEEEQMNLALKLSKEDKLSAPYENRKSEAALCPDRPFNNASADQPTRGVSATKNPPRSNPKIKNGEITGSMYSPEELVIVPRSNRFIVVDAANVGFHHGGHKFFSLKGVTICLEFFTRRGHQVAAFMQKSRYNNANEEDKAILDIMVDEKMLVFVPPGSYDDLFTIKYAASRKGIVVSNDRFQDVKQLNDPVYTEQVEKRVLKFSWLGDTFMVPDDPLGRTGPTLNQFLIYV